MSTFVIAEAGVNHNGDIGLAYRLIDAAVDAGADAVKFQTFKAEALASAAAGKAEYQKKLTEANESQIDMLRALELSHEAHFELKAYCESKGIEFFSTAFEAESLRFLIEDLGLKRLKIPSGEITNHPFVYQHAESGLPIIVSTGMASIDEIEQALKIIAAGYAKHAGRDFGTDWDAAFANSEVWNMLCERVHILHCVSDYPAQDHDLNLQAIRSIVDTFNLPVGYSDHSLGIWAPVYAVALGARVIEKHFTLDKTLPGPDHQASLSPQELKSMVLDIRKAERAGGSGEKVPQASELANRIPIRKSLVVTADIAQGETIMAHHLTAKRPATGMSPAHYWRVLGATSTRSYTAGEMLDEPLT